MSRQYFSVLVCSVLSVDECLIKIIFGRIFVASRKLCRVTSFLNDMQC